MNRPGWVRIAFVLAPLALAACAFQPMDSGADADLPGAQKGQPLVAPDPGDDAAEDPAGGKRPVTHSTDNRMERANNHGGAQPDPWGGGRPLWIVPNDGK